ncbi:MAG: BrnT family toxin [Treponema sp.]|jgi:uncharacterized DUF497 family protein|nr:BrnT family toxin [Treponema sp.]
MYTWTEEKNQRNKQKHGLFFSEITDVFDDSHLIEWYDKAHSSLNEDRYICLGRLHDTVILFVVYTERGDNIHIISARTAEPHEERLYYEYYEREVRGN